MAHWFVERDEYLERITLRDGFVDFLVHQRWWHPWKPWAACACIWGPGASEPTVLHKREWTGRRARARCHEMQEWIASAC